MRRCAVSIDVDSITCYYRIHGLGPAPEALAHCIIERCVPRFAEIFERRGILATFFLVGRDLDVDAMGKGADRACALVRDLWRAGHELGNHSYSHPYDLARMSSAEIGMEIGRAHEILEEVSGGEHVIRGFRAPGYDVSPAILEHLMRLGYGYDSSIFPAPGYYLAKAAVMGVLALAGRRSGAVLINPRALVAPTVPYRPSVDAPWRRGRASPASIVELPIAVTPWTRTPVIGTSLLMAPWWLAERWLAAVTARPFFNFELHGIDLADAELDGIPAALVARQPDLRVPLRDKKARLERILDHVAGICRFTRLGDEAALVQAQA